MQTTIEEKIWIEIAHVSEFSPNGGTCAKIGDEQIAIFHFQQEDEWYACENRCPHTGDMVLSRGLTGDAQGEPKVACPLHKKSFSLKSGECISGESYSVRTFPVMVEDGMVYVAVESSMVAK
ncbi:nitrite reductase small subunit NirD [Leptospira barantonii]|uniref:Nitrite reductase (NAD(P)H) small subunit n=1 Tax=Leptospira barantonii TaxID=2023184 RepID=A0ABX4NJK1_9LEPT|nr:nitrite reductase small subunit NirD [Leptospira barantonii]PJZ56940.1 nitrite reductase (NAD(P)H) small subunit [Leptospira barantonii]